MYKHLVTAVSFAVLGACASQGELISERDITDIQKSAQGVWLSDGYGYVLDLSEGQKVYNITSISCLEIADGQENPMEYFDRFQVNSKKTTLRLFSNVEPYPISFTKMEALPEACAQPASTNPLDVFDTYAAYFSEHYGFFDVQDIDWAEATMGMRASLNSESGEMDLVEHFIGLLSQFRDGHVSISATVDGDEGQFIAYAGPTNDAVQQSDGKGKSPSAAFGEQYLRKDIERDILGAHGFDAVNERIKYGITSNDIGYMAVMSEGGYTKGKDASLKDELDALNIAMAQIIRTFEAAGVKSVIIDLSVNHGGYDFLGRAIAGYFTDVPVVAYSKHASDAQDGAPYVLKVLPANGPHYTGPVYVMTSDVTVSAGEVMTLSLRALPNVIHVGMPTRGAFSDVLTKYLPNGWEITLSNEVYTDSDGIVWEGRGIEPEIKIQVFDPQNPLSGHMPAITKLIEIIDTP